MVILYLSTKKKWEKRNNCGRPGNEGERRQLYINEKKFVIVITMGLLKRRSTFLTLLMHFQKSKAEKFLKLVAFEYSFAMHPPYKVGKKKKNPKQIKVLIIGGLLHYIGQLNCSGTYIVSNYKIDRNHIHHFY